MAGVRYSYRGVEQLREALGRLQNLTVTDKTRVLRVVGMEFVRDAQRNIREKHGPNGQRWPDPPKHRPGGKRLEDTRRLHNSITYEISRSSAFIGTNVIYAAIHQYGGIIRPKRGKKLLIPLSRKAARRYAGDARRDYPGAFVMKSRKGNLLLAKRKGKGKNATIELIGVLRDLVYIPASPYLGDSPRAWGTIEKRVNTMFAAAWGTAA